MAIIFLYEWRIICNCVKHATLEYLLEIRAKYNRLVKHNSLLIEIGQLIDC